MSQMKKFLQKLLGDKAGASAAEYALILAVFGGAVVLGVTALGQAFNDAITDANTDLESGYTGTGAQ